MSSTRHSLGLLMAAASYLATATAAFSCGFENPNSVALARGALNWAYPNALHVTTAVWKAQLDGRIVGSEAQPLTRYHKALDRLGMFRDRLETAINSATMPAFSVVFVGPMLWTNYRQAGTKLEMSPHAEGPLNGNVVIVTDESVISALVEGRILPQSARELGLMRLFGSATAVQDVTSWLDRLSPGADAKATNANH